MGQRLFNSSIRPNTMHQSGNVESNDIRYTLCEIPSSIHRAFIALFGVICRKPLSVDIANSAYHSLSDFTLQLPSRSSKPFPPILLIAHKSSMPHPPRRYHQPFPNNIIDYFNCSQQQTEVNLIRHSHCNNIASKFEQ
jgi:hypothetical protein